MNDKDLLSNKVICYEMVGLGHDVSFTITTADGVWNWKMVNTSDDSLNYDDCPVSVQKVADETFIVGRPDFDPAETVVLVFNFADMKVYVSGKDNNGKHAFMQGTITQYSAL